MGDLSINSNKMRGGGLPEDKGCGWKINAQKIWVYKSCISRIGKIKNKIRICWEDEIIF